MHGRTLPRQWDGPVSSLILPTFNPGADIDRACREVMRFLDEQTRPWEVLFICDGCSDGTPERLARLRGGDERIRIVAYAPNRGKGHAVRHGLALARGEWRVFTDVDLAYSFADILRVHARLLGGADVAIASRVHADSTLVVPYPLQGYVYRRHLQSQAFAALVRCLLPLRQGDTQAGLKGMTGETARRILPFLRCDGFGFDCELLTACAYQGLQVAEVPVAVRYTDARSTTSLHTATGMIRELWKIRRAWRKGPPAGNMGENLPKVLPQEGRKVA